MNRNTIINTIGSEYLTANLEKDEYSYVKAAGNKIKLKNFLGEHETKRKFADIRFLKDDVVILVETKQQFTKKDEKQLADYLAEEKAVHKTKKVICILANTNNDKVKVWKNSIDDDHFLSKETSLKNFEYYENIFKISKQNEREKVLKNTLDLNVLLHKMDIKESLRSQFVGTTLLYIKNKFNGWNDNMSARAIRHDIVDVLDGLLGGTDNKDKKIELLQKNVFSDQKVQNLTKENWIEILNNIRDNIYKYIDMDSDEGQDILNLFFIAFNKYTGKADKNQAFTPDHITDFMCRLTGVNHNTIVMDITCGSGSFLVQAMMKALADCPDEKSKEVVAKKHIYGIENEEKAYGLATTNMLIHGDGNSNIKFESCFKCEDFIINANPDIILMNPPYNAKPMTIPDKYKSSWGNAADGKEDPTKGFVFIHFFSDVVKQTGKEVKLAVLLPVSAAIGTSKIITEEKKFMLENNTLEAVFTLPNEIFYPGASVNACCMLFTLGRSHFENGKPRQKTFFGYCKDDGFKKKKNLGRVEQFNDKNQSKWKTIEDRWLQLFNDKEEVDGLSAKAYVTGDDEWLCEAYMKTDYSKLTEDDFQQTVNNYLAYLIKEGKKKFKSSTVAPLNINNWKEFSLSELFDIRKGKRLTSEDQEPGEYNYVGAIDSNNGIANHIAQKPIHEGNTISLSYNGSVGEAFYQREPYWATDDVNALYPKYTEFNEYIGLFIATIIRQEKYKFSYGRKWTLENMKKTIIKLPTDSIGKPNYKFMENYIKSLNCKPLTTNNKEGQVPPLNADHWKDFKIGNLFTIVPTKGKVTDDLAIGRDVPYISAKHDLNGFDMLCSKQGVEDWISKGNCIVFIQIGEGSCGYANYMKEDFIGMSGKTCCGYIDGIMNEYIGLFLSTILSQERPKYSFGRSWTGERLTDTKIKLPTTEDGEPDWKFMENYIKALPYADSEILKGGGIE